MKQLILLMTVFFTCFGLKAQESTTDYIYSSDGFEVKTGYFTDRYGATRISTGLYSKDGKVLVSVADYGISSFYVLEGTEVICSNAFQSINGCSVYIPSSVRYIAPDALLANRKDSSGNYIAGIVDGCKEQSGSSSVNAPAADPNATEVARYNIQGVKLPEPTNGINIVQYSDGTADKVLVK